MGADEGLMEVRNRLLSELCNQGARLEDMAYVFGVTKERVRRWLGRRPEAKAKYSELLLARFSRIDAMRAEYERSKTS